MQHTLKSALCKSLQKKNDNMKKLILTVLLVTFISIIYSRADTIDVKINYELAETDKYFELKFHILITDTISQENNPVTFFRFDNQLQIPTINQAEIKSQVIGNILSSKKLKIYVFHPDYIRKIFDLIVLKQDKETAIKLYDENNLQSGIQFNTNSGSNTVNNKKLASTTSIVITIPVIIIASEIFIFNEIYINIATKCYKTNKLEIDLTKHSN